MNNILHITCEKVTEEIEYLSEYYNLKKVDINNYISDIKTDLILLHTYLPYLANIKLLEEIKDNSNVPVILIAPNMNHTDEVENILKYADDYIFENFNGFDLLNKLKTHLKLSKLEFMLKEERLFNESIMESSTNLLFIQDNKKILKANNAFLSFFQIDNIEEFNARHKCISEVFMEYENFYSKYILNHEQDWLDKISHDKKSNEYKILIMDINTFEPKAFQIHVTALNNSDKFLVTLVDITKITMKSKKFEIQATYDDLTKVYNRTKFNEIMETQYLNWEKTGEPLCFAIFDIDFFKIVNDEFGHIIGDETLLVFAQTINNNINGSDIFARWGGEEFTLLLPYSEIDEAYQIVENLRIMIEKVKFSLIGTKTCSIGITQFTKNDTILDVITRADEALYEAKKSGRNKVCIK